MNSAAKSHKISYPGVKWQGVDAKSLNFKKKPLRDKKSGMLNSLYNKDDRKPSDQRSFCIQRCLDKTC